MTEKLKIVLIYCISIAILISVGTFAYQSTNQYKSASEWVNHTQEVISETQAILANIQSVESSQRGYVITGDSKYLNNFELGIRNCELAYSKVLSLTVDNSGQQIILNSLKPIINSKIEFTKQVVDERRKSGYSAAQKLILTDLGENLMLEIRLSCTTFINNEKSLLSERLSVARKNFFFTQTIIIISILLTVVILLFALYFFLKDYNRRILVEKKLIEAKKIAEESSSLKEAFLANMSHEIRTPMNAILGFTDLLLKRDLDNQGKDYAHTIKNSGEILLRIINDILDVSKIESGIMAFEEHPLSVSEMFSSINVLVSNRAKEKGLELSFQCDSSIPSTLLGDPTRLTQILINLIGNAIKFTERGKVDVFAKAIKEEGDLFSIEFTVVDSGIGIDEDKLKLIFERFRQAESHTTRNYGGTGLGLSIAKQLVELQGGEIGVKSQAGIGTAFTFTLPLRKTSEITPRLAKKIPKADLTMSELCNKKILLVEDNPINIKFMLSLFDEFDIKTELAENGKIAVEKVKEKQYDLILMDIEMPVMNGYEATTFIRQELKSTVPIIAMTAHAMAGETEKCLSLGMNAYISKPVKERLLFEKMLQLTVTDDSMIKIGKASPLINLDFLVKSMRGKKDVIRETIDIYLTQMPEDFSVLTEAVLNMDYQSIKRSAHRIKSTVALMGIVEMEKMLEELETLSEQNKNDEQIRKLYSTLKELESLAVEELNIEKIKFI